MATAKKDFAYVALGRVASGLAAALISVVIARTATIETVAGYHVAFSMILFLSILTQFGLPQSTTRQIALALHIDSKKLAQKIAGFSLLLIVFFSSVIVFLWVFLYEFIIHQTSVYQVLSGKLIQICIWILLFSLQNFIAEVFRANMYIHLASIFNGTLSNILFLIGLFIQYKVGIKIDIDLIFITNNFVIFVSVFISLFYAYRYHVLSFFLNICEEWQFNLMKSGFFNVITGVFSFFILQANLIIFSTIGTKEEVAMYGIANRLIVILGMINAMIASVYLPRIAKLAAGNDLYQLQKLATHIAKITTLVALIPCFSFIFFPAMMLRFLFGDAYANAASMVSMMTIGFFVTSLVGLRSQILMMLGFEKTQSMISMVSGVLVIFLVYFFAKKYGVHAGVLISSLLIAAIGIVESVFLYLRSGILSVPFCKNTTKDV